jgi:UDP-2,4-diacetamido-2,4,6-trideoxy-beta-L-altropyranose hydrolase
MRRLSNPTGMRILFRVDASPTIGGGHVMRCMTLAAALVRRGADVAFLCQEHTAVSVPALTQAGWPIKIVDVAPEAACAAAASLWPTPADMIIIDSYAISRGDEEILSRCARLVMTITDLLGMPHACDLLLDQNIGRTPAHYLGEVPDLAVVLTGSPYALLRPEFAERRVEALNRRKKTGKVNTILVSLGLSNVGELTALVVRAAVDATPEAAINVVVGPAMVAGSAIARVAEATHRVRLLSGVKDMCSLMIEADLSIGAAGSTAWERCCLGLPSIALILADNQRPIAQELASRGAVLAIEAGTRDLESRLQQNLRELASNASMRHDMSRRSADLVDGLGADRVVDEILRLQPHQGAG